jgi:hypothetical protein
MARTTDLALTILPHHVNFPIRSGGESLTEVTLITGYNLTVRVVATEPILLTGEQIIDGVRVLGGETVLVTGQLDPKKNGLYVCLPGAWRINDAVPLYPSTIIAVREGWYYQDSIWLVKNDATVSYGYSENFFVRKDFAPVLPCRFALTTLTAALDQTTTTIDGSTPQNGDRILVAKTPVLPAETHADNGIWVYDDAAAWQRSRDQLYSGMLVTVREGTTEKDSVWMLTSDTPITTTFVPVGLEDVGMTVSPVRWTKIAPVQVCSPILLHYALEIPQNLTIPATTFHRVPLSLPVVKTSNAAVQSSTFLWTVQETGAYDCECILHTNDSAVAEGLVCAIMVQGAALTDTPSDTSLVLATPMKVGSLLKFRLKGAVLLEQNDRVSIELRVQNHTASTVPFDIQQASMRVRKLCS